MTRARWHLLHEAGAHRLARRKHIYGQQARAAAMLATLPHDKHGRCGQSSGDSSDESHHNACHGARALHMMALINS